MSQYPLVVLEPSLSASAGRRASSRAAWRRHRPFLLLLIAIVLLGIGAWSPADSESDNWPLAALFANRALRRWNESAQSWSFSSSPPPDEQLDVLDLTDEDETAAIVAPESIGAGVYSGQADEDLDDGEDAHVETDDDADEDVAELLDAMATAVTERGPPPAAPALARRAATVAPLALPAALANAARLDLLTSLRPAPAYSRDLRYLAFASHSGFANQRIELVNALVLAGLLNRTLLVPPVRLGLAADWAPTTRAQREQANEQKNRLQHCAQWLPTLEAAKHRAAFRGPKECANYARYTTMSWDWLLNMSAIAKHVDLVDRADLSVQWLSASDGLGVPAQSIVTIPDRDRYDARFYEMASDRTPLAKYMSRVNLATLRSGRYGDASVLSLGSVFGSSRVVTKSAQARELRTLANKATVFRNPLLTSMGDQIVQSLGGPANYLGVHCRVGDGTFADMATRNMEATFRLLTRSLGVPAASVTKLLKDSRRWRPTASQGRQRTDTSLRCRGHLYTDPKLAMLNTRLYMATDSRDPVNDPRLQVFYSAFPCIFTLADFGTPEGTPQNNRTVPELVELASTRSAHDGVRVAPLLHAFLEALVVARSSIGSFGTAGSTFSGFATTTLHRALAADQRRVAAH